ncbi:MAG TPA: 4-hydroxythreonine-4-phosphate dehydrogenase PdxA [Pirellulales bacterium]|nr:4-hydroxythreonine-4-phosphate dehydrogenase PdxA [Pirellulales bacterium]
MMRASKPLVALTMGDPAGIGPEVIAGIWSVPQIHEWCQPVVVGSPAVLERACKLVARNVKVVEVRAPDEVAATPALAPCLAACATDAASVPAGKVDARGGQAAYDALIAAAKMALAGEIDAIVTAPLSKAALWQAGHHYPGHTELLAELCGVNDFAMMLYLGPDEQVRGPHGLGVIHVTLHTALRDAIAALDEEAILAKIELAHASMRPLTGGPPRLGVCALNPHAGEEGLFGDEETRLIAPAVARARGLGIDAAGPYPADTLMARARDGEFDAVVAMYHDQGHIALKLLGMHRAVNVTLGLPIVRTSVAHGTAFDIAWQGRARTSSMTEAVRVACQLARYRSIQASPLK